MRHIIEEFNRIALSNPDCKLQLIHNEKEIFYYEKNNFRQRIVNVIGLKNNEHLVPIKESTSLVKLMVLFANHNMQKKQEENSIFLSIKDISKIIKFKMQLQKHLKD